MDIFKEILPSILVTKKYCLNDELDEKSYVPFIINRALSFHADCVLYAQEMNLMAGLDKKCQYDFLINTIRARKRPFAPWVKPTKEKNLAAIKAFFGYSNAKAMEVLKILTEEQVAQICEKMNTNE